MKLSLWAKVLLLAFLNVILVAVIFAALLHSMLARNIDALVLGSSRERILAVVRDLTSDLNVTPVEERSALIARYSGKLGIPLYLFLNGGMQAAGPPIALPDDVAERLSEAPRGVPGMGMRGLARPQALAQNQPFLVVSNSAYWIGIRMPISNSGNLAIQLGTLFFVSPTLLRQPFLFDPKPWLGYLGLVLAATFVCWLPLVGNITSSIKKMMLSTARIAAGQFNFALPVQRGDELGSLGVSIGQMAGQLEEHMNGQKRFLRDAAHELRSPLARMQAAMGILERQSGPESEEALEDLREEIELMSGLTGDLLTLSRSEHRPEAPRLQPVRLAEVAERAVTTESAGHEADIRMDIDSAILVTAADNSLFRGISNLLRNAIRYAAASGPILVAASSRNGQAVLTVRDHGPGIPEDAMDRVFSPFFRLDDSRDRKTGGTGLGMSIARACIQTCSGTISCANAGPGLRVTITLPLATADMPNPAEPA